MEQLTYKELTALQMPMSKGVLEQLGAGNMNQMAVQQALTMDLMQIMNRYQNVDDIEEFDLKLQAQFEEQSKRDTENGKKFYLIECPHCSAPINHKPESKYEEILCPTCAGNVSFDMDNAQPAARSAMIQEEKSQRMMELAEEMKAAQADENKELHDKLQEEYTKISTSFGVNFDWSQHKDNEQQIIDITTPKSNSGEEQMGGRKKMELNEENDNEKTPTALASDMGHDEVVSYLESEDGLIEIE